MVSCTIGTSADGKSTVKVKVNLVFKVLKLMHSILTSGSQKNDRMCKGTVLLVGMA